MNLVVEKGEVAEWFKAPSYAEASDGRPDYLADEAPKERSRPPRLRLAGRIIVESFSQRS
jgi:hypothetical protein